MKSNIRLYYDERGLDRYYGLLELGELGGMWKNVAGRYEMNGKKIYGKEILKNPTEYFTDDIMEKLDNYSMRSSFLMDRIETTILQNLIYNEEYSRKVIPFIKPDYFENKSERVVFEQIAEFIVKYGSAITIEALNIEVDNRVDLTETEVKEIRELNGFLTNTPVDYQWLMDTTEKWCRDRAIYLSTNGINCNLQMVMMTKKDKDAIP